MKLTFAATLLLVAMMLVSTRQTVSASPGYRSCLAKVLYSEELPFAPIGTWLVRATLEITPPHGSPYFARLEEWMPWQGRPPRRGQIFRVRCDPADPGNPPLIPAPRI
jgi:hypothetical protein